MKQIHELDSGRVPSCVNIYRYLEPKDGQTGIIFQNYENPYL